MWSNPSWEKSLKGEEGAAVRYLFLFSPCTVLTSSTGVCCLYRKIIQEASYPNPSHKVMVSVPPLDPQFHMQSHPCRMETESIIPITFHLVFSKHVFVLLLFAIPASIIACFPHSPIPGKSSSAFVFSPVAFSHLCHSFPDRTWQLH